MVAMARTLDWRWLLVVVPWALVPLIDLRRRRDAGAILLDIGGSGDRWHVLAYCGMVVAGGFAGMFSGYGAVFPAFFVFLGVGAGFITWRTRRFQLCETGFWSAGRLIPWERIESYAITAIGSLNLKISGKSPKFCCDVPQALRPRAEDLLASKCCVFEAKA
jgi:hypothetical protein